MSSVTLPGILHKYAKYTLCKKHTQHSHVCQLSELTARQRRQTRVIAISRVFLALRLCAEKAGVQRIRHPLPGRRVSYRQSFFEWRKRHSLLYAVGNDSSSLRDSPWFFWRRWQVGPGPTCHLLQLLRSAAGAEESTTTFPTGSDVSEAVPTAGGAPPHSKTHQKRGRRNAPLSRWKEWG